MQLIYIEIQQSNQCYMKQECIPVGCGSHVYPSMHWEGGVCLGVICPGVCLTRGVSAEGVWPERGVCPGGCLSRGVYPSMH